jgi:hypothetical protein
MTTLAEALRNIIGLIDAGWLIRSTANDFSPGWSMKQLPNVMILAHAVEALAAHDAQPQKTRQDFIDGYDAGMIDGRACWKRDHDAQQQGPAISDFHNPWRTSLENCISGDNYLRASEYRDLIEELDELYRYRSGTHDAMMEDYANGRSDEHEAQQQEPVGWIESPHGAFRANPNYRWDTGPTTVTVSIPLYTKEPTP